MTTVPATIFDQLVAQLHLEPDHKGECWLACPWCERKNKHFSFSDRGFNCFGCGEKGKSLARLAAQLNIRADTPSRIPPKRVVRASQRPKDWQRAPDRWLDHYGAALDRVTAWQSYKPLSLDSIARFRLGVGVLPASRCTAVGLTRPIASGRRRRIAGIRKRSGRCSPIQWNDGCSDRRSVQVCGERRQEDDHHRIDHHRPPAMQMWQAPAADANVADLYDELEATTKAWKREIK